MRKDGKKMKSNPINKFFKRILTTVLTVSLATIPALSVAPSLTVHADDFNADGDSGKTGQISTTSGAAGGVKTDNTGVLFYCLNREDGKIYSRFGSSNDEGVVFLYSPLDSAPETIEAKGNEPNLDLNKSYYRRTILGDELGDYKYDMPKLFTFEGNHFESHYSEWNSWFEQPVTDPTSGDTMPVAKYIIKNYFPDAWKKAQNGEEVSLLAEPIAWHSLFKSGSKDSSDGELYVLTPTGWAGKKIDNGLEDVRTFTCSFDRCAFAWAMRLERIQFGWWTFGPAMKTSGFVPNKEIWQNGYGVNIYNLDTTPGHSIVTPTPAPADVESETPTNYSVIKVYERENPETKEIVSEGSYITTNAYSDLTVNEEEGWKIISVETVSPQIKTIGSNDVYEVVKGDT